MTGLDSIIHPVDVFQLSNLTQRFLVKRGMALKSVENNALQQITQRQVMVLGQALEDLDHAFLHPHSNLDPLNGSVARSVFVCVHASPSSLLPNKLPTYLSNLVII